MLTKWFCGAQLKKIDSLNNLVQNQGHEIFGLKNKVSELESQITQKDSRIEELLEGIHELECTVQDTDMALIRCSDHVTDLTVKLNAYKQKSKTMEEQLNVALAALAESVQLPDIDVYMADVKAMNPWTHPELSRQEDNPITGKPRMVYNLHVADESYYTLDLEQWGEILNPILKAAYKALGRPRVPLADCDNYAITTEVFLALATLKCVELDRHLALAVAWGHGHAYNVFFCSDGSAYVYEPMLTGEIVGELGRTAKPYDTYSVWFAH